MYNMPIPRYIATLALMPKSALNKCWRYIEGALYLCFIIYFAPFTLLMFLFGLIQCEKLKMVVTMRLKVALYTKGSKIY